MAGYEALRASGDYRPGQVPRTDSGRGERLVSVPVPADGQPDDPWAARRNVQTDGQDDLYRPGRTPDRVDADSLLRLADVLSDLVIAGRRLADAWEAAGRQISALSAALGRTDGSENAGEGSPALSGGAGEA